MMEALKNPHYKKIWEDINWEIRHSEAKSLEEALLMETMKFGCVLFNHNQTFCHARVVGNNDCAGYQYLTVESTESSNVNQIFIHLKEIGENVQILGRPITLEDILILLGKNTRQANEIGIIMIENGNLYVKPGTGGKYDFEWEYSKPLDEQSEDTWNKIYEIINK